MKVGAIIQARMGSSRFPGKIMTKLPLSGDKTLLDHILDRIPNEIECVIATSVNSENDILQGKYSNVFRGDEDDVLKRFYNCATEKEFDQIIRLTGDNPIIDTDILLETLKKHILAKNDYTCTKGLPLGCNFEIMSYDALKKSYFESKTQKEREHVTVYMKNNSVFQKQTIIKELCSGLRLTVDYASDFALLSIIFDILGDQFNLKDLENLMSKYPWLIEINSSNIQIS